MREDQPPAQPHILIIDDTPEILDLLRELLSDEGYRVSTSLTVMEPDALKALAPDAILLDPRFGPSQDPGWTFLTLAQHDEGLAGIGFVLCTAAAAAVNDPDIAHRLTTLGVPVVLKPFDVNDLLTAIADQIASRSRSEPASAEPAGY